LPYQDPERKRQWELEHREERNARRRMSRPPIALDRSCETLTYASTKHQKAGASATVITTLAMGLTLVVTLLFVALSYRVKTEGP
jgi:hypothetical protein